VISDERRQLVDNIRIAIAEEKTEETVLRVAAELIDGFSEGYNWTGFYMMRGDHLEVGPYIGPETEHTKIDLSSGICGAAASQKETVLVDDVKSDERFLACSLTTRSEIVVPLMDGSVCMGEIDIDSDQPAHFGREDKEMLEEVAVLVVERLKEINS